MGAVAYYGSVANRPPLSRVNGAISGTVRVTERPPAGAGG